MEERPTPRRTLAAKKRFFGNSLKKAVDSPWESDPRLRRLLVVRELCHAQK